MLLEERIHRFPVLWGIAVSPSVFDHGKLIRLTVGFIDIFYLTGSLPGALNAKKIFRGCNYQRGLGSTDLQQIRMIDTRGDAPVEVLFSVLWTNGLQQAREGCNITSGS